MEPKQTVLVIEDDYSIRHLLETVLSQNGYVVTAIDSGENALKRIPSLKPSLILLDIQLPKMSGLEFCKQIRATPQVRDTPIILVSAHSSEIYKITGLETGADDFITKPFSTGELLARVKAVLRRSQRLKAASGHLIKKGAFNVDLENRTVLMKDKKLKLTPKEFTLLTVLLQSEGTVMSRDTLSAQIWERENITTSRTIDVHVARLRKKLGLMAKVIETVGKMGYRYHS